MTLETDLGNILPPRSLLTSAEAKRPYECDGLSAYQQIPRVVALPETREQVEAVVKICAAHAVPVIARGAGTG